MKTINVVYSLYNASGSFVKNIVASENSELSQVSNITEQVLPSFTITTGSNWSGYEMYGSATQQTDAIYKTQSLWTVAAVYKPFSLGCINTC